MAHSVPDQEMREYSPRHRLLKKVQMQGGLPEVERGVLKVRRSEHRGKPTPQMGLFSNLVL
jgi:hypothetical protein